MKTGMVAGALLGFLAAVPCQAQASKPKVADPASSVTPANATQASEAVPAATTTRTATARPADLDPRIPWLDILGVPQSGGPEPWVMVKTFHLPREFPHSDVALPVGEDRFALSWMERVGECDETGRLLWSATVTTQEGLPISVLGSNGLVAGNDGTLLVITARGGPGGPGEDILRFDASGRLVGRWRWPRGIRDEVECVSYLSGYLIADLGDSTREIVPVDPQGYARTEDLASPRDFDIQFSKKDKIATIQSRPVVPTHEEDKVRLRKEEYERRTRRMRGWEGRRLDLQALPFRFPAKLRKESYVTVLSDYTVIRIEPRGGILLRCELHNPLGLTPMEYREKEKDWLYFAWAWFDTKGALVRYLIVPPSSSPAFSGDRLGVVTSTGVVKVWEPIEK